MTSRDDDFQDGLERGIGHGKPGSQRGIGAGKAGKIRSPAVDPHMAAFQCCFIMFHLFCQGITAFTTVHYIHFMILICSEKPCLFLREACAPNHPSR